MGSGPTISLIHYISMTTLIFLFRICYFQILPCIMDVLMVVMFIIWTAHYIIWVKTNSGGVQSS